MADPRAPADRRLLLITRSCTIDRI